MQYDFGKQVAEIVARTKIRMDLVVRKFCFEMFSDIMLASPVDTGAFRGNWMLSVGSPNLTTNMTAALPEDNTALASVNSAMATTISKEAIGKVIYFTNSMPYAYRLEHGWSKQAPAGMVGVTVAAYQSNLSKALGV